MAQEPDTERVEGEARQGLRWGVERRLEFIDFRLFWDGRINRGDLTEQFGISDSPGVSRSRTVPGDGAAQPEL